MDSHVPEDPPRCLLPEQPRFAVGKALTWSQAVSQSAETMLRKLFAMNRHFLEANDLKFKKKKFTLFKWLSIFKTISI